MPDQGSAADGVAAGAAAPAQGVLPAAEGPGGGLAYNIFRSKYLLAGASGEQLEDGGCQQRAVLQVKLGGEVRQAERGLKAHMQAIFDNV